MTPAANLHGIRQDEALAFYRDILGLEPRVDVPFGRVKDLAAR